MDFGKPVDAVNSPIRTAFRPPASLIAYPAEYGNSGIMTFMVNHDGTVWEKDFGLKTAKLAQKIESFTPDQSWTKVEVAP